MKKNILLQLFNGFKSGVFIGLMLSIFFSFMYSDDVFSPMPSPFIEKFPSELRAFIVSVLLWGLIGVLFTMTNFIFTSTDWSITKMTISHALISYVLFLPIALYLNWINLTLMNILSFTMIYVVIYIFLWSISMMKVKKEITKINEHLR